MQDIAVKNRKIDIVEAGKEHLTYANAICQLIEEAAKERGTGIAKREPLYIKNKMIDGKAVIAITSDKLVVGFCYIESWGVDKNYVANSGLIVAPEFRGLGLAKKIKEEIFLLSQKRFPNAKMFGITTSPAVMRINYSLGYRPVSFDHLTDDESFWKGCQSCKNYDILQRTNQKHCLCTAMLYDPEEIVQIKTKDNIKYEKESTISI
jgi:GNAT superfamily N-acetyltransferase